MRRKPAILLLVSTLAAAAWLGYRFFTHGKLDENGARVRTVAARLEAEGARGLAARPARELQDAWGRPLTIRTWRSNGVLHSRVESLGSDGRRGPCCVGMNGCESPRCDWILEDGRYVAW